jgi:alpha-tubulin suppressor-like RCC1 family protein
LGDGQTATTRYSFQAATLSLLPGDIITGAIAGPYNAIVRTNSSRYWMWGDTAWGPTGFTNALPASGTILSSPVELFVNQPTKRIGLIAIYDKSVLIVTDGCDYPTLNISVPAPYAPCGVGGKLYSFGDNTFGQLGDSSNTSRYAPVPVNATLFSNAISIVEAGPISSYVVTSDGQLYAWGSNSQCMHSYYNTNDLDLLGDNSTQSTNRNSPVLIDTLQKTIVSIAVGTDTCLAQTSDNFILGWGTNLYGTIGDGSNTARVTPYLTSKGAISGRVISRLLVGNYHAVALTTDSKVYAWGLNTNGQLGDGTVVNRYFALLVTQTLIGSKRVTDIAVGGSFTMVLMSDNTLYSWGSCTKLDNTPYCVGDNTATTYRSSPVAMDISQLGGRAIKRITASYAMGVALTTDGYIYVFGDNTPTIAGDNLAAALQRLVQNSVFNTYAGLSSAEIVSSVTAGALHAYVITNMNRTFIYGDNIAGQIGLGTTTLSAAPYLMYPVEQYLPSLAFANFTSYKNYYPGRTYYHTLALTDGCTYSVKPNSTATIPTLKCNTQNKLLGFGVNSQYQLGTGNNTSVFDGTSTPVDMSGVLQDQIIVSVKAGAHFYVAMSSNGTLYSWGVNSNGQLGGMF